MTIASKCNLLVTDSTSLALTMATYGRPNIVLGAMEHGRRLNESQSRKVTLDFLRNDFKEIDTAYVE